MQLAGRIRNKIKKEAGKVKDNVLQAVSGGCVVLLYHRIADLQTDPQELAVTPENFRTHLRILNEKYNVLEPAEFKYHLSSKKKFPPRSILITFDDGYADNFEHALHLLSEASVGALFYICTGLLNTELEFWWDELENDLLVNPHFRGGVSVTIGSRIYSCTEKMTSRTALYNSLLPVLRAMDFEQRENKISEIREQCGNPAPRKTHRILSHPELVMMSHSTQVTLGAHTVNHCSLASLTRKEQEKEILTSLDTIEKITGVRPEDFSYPFGTEKDFTVETENICRAARLKFVAANIPGRVSARSAPVSFHRFLVRNWNEENFIFHLNNFFG